MKYIGLLASSVCVVVVLLINSYYSIINLDIQKISSYVVESNMILEDIITKEESVLKDNKEYIDRLQNLKKCIEDTKTSFFTSKYKDYRIKSVESMIESISNDKKNNEHLNMVKKYNELSEKELDSILEKNFFEVTYLYTLAYE
ncbi:hypothetical protein UT300012_18540 [Paraclostridium bifermentans]|jgi:hypothetical protein|uniref:hypothetical protein n=1 Tax=Paraclostridium bifermentans TaxID=1490 RepID=UPI000DF73CD0|nr:hypothetical protein [Paraclostridium bifermentans]MBS5953264.1 hypothetical protein [Paraclostridium bifermentans]MBU5288544.1 hypothetical protein [Paraclostridium bifermentans]MDU3335882.1 hypothetical protein [Paraclostridium bifermentans]RDC49371.1 hypothetical protein DVA85_24125 [Acinetobacter sp. RIT592]